MDEEEHLKGQLLEVFKLGQERLGVMVEIVDHEFI
jgi:hypothetical protein